MGMRQGFFRWLRPRPKPPAPEPPPTVEEPLGVDNLGGGGEIRPEDEADAIRRWNEWSARTRAEHAEVKRKREERERKAREKSEGAGRLRGLLDRIPLVHFVDKTGSPLLPRYGPVTPWPWPGFTPIATPMPSGACPDGVAEHRRRVNRYNSLPSDSDEREDLGENCWQHGGTDTAAKQCPVCFPGLKRRRQLFEERKARGETGFSFAIVHRPPDDDRPR